MRSDLPIAQRPRASDRPSLRVATAQLRSDRLETALNPLGGGSVVCPDTVHAGKRRLTNLLKILWGAQTRSRACGHVTCPVFVNDPGRWARGG
jgi:hypothetical protein